MTRRLGLVLFVLVVAGTACAKATAGGGGPNRIPHPTGPNDLILRVRTAGGFLSPAYALTQFPEFSLYGDGRLITGGPQIQIYPGPALPNLLVRRISEDGIQAILRAARAAGLFGPDHHYVNMVVADAPTTTFTLVAAGSRHVISAYALGMSGGHVGGQASEPDRKARAALVAFQAKLSNLASWLPKGSVGQEQPFLPAGLRVFVSAYAPAQLSGPKQPAIDWPLATPLAAFGTPVPTWSALRCGAVTGTYLAKLLTAARRANQLTPWRSGKTTYSITFRPLLLDESGCPR